MRSLRIALFVLYFVVLSCWFGFGREIYHTRILVNKWAEVNPLTAPIPRSLLDETKQQYIRLIPLIDRLDRLTQAPVTSRIFSFTGQNDRYQQIRHVFGQWQVIKRPTQDLLESLPQILGYERRQHYVVLLQNNMELRPTGGFMGSYADFWMDQGQLKDLFIQDIYVPDGQIKGYVKEPSPIQTHLFNQNHPGWRLRDSNWNPDFPETKKAIKWFFNEGNLEPIDGMAAINLIPILDIITVLGPLEIPDYGITLTHENFYLLTQATVETDFFPGSTQKRDYLGAVGKTIVTRLQQDSSLVPQLMPILFKNLQRNQIFISLDNEMAHSFFKTLNWEGSLFNVSSFDYVFWNESNMGSNKTNCCIERSFSDVITTESNKLTHEWTLFYKNNNPGVPQPPLHFGGGYKNYVRLFVPLDAVLEHVVINGVTLTESQIDVEDVGDKKSIGFLNLTEGGQESTIHIRYNRAVPSDSDYTLVIQKQSGIDSIPVTITYDGRPLTPQQFELIGNHTLSIGD